MSPGPTSIYVAKNSIAISRKHGLFTALGTGTGAAVFGLLAVLGLQAFLLAVPSAYLALKICGGIYLLWLAFKIIKNAKEPIEADHSSSKAMTLRRAFMTGLITQLSNPKIAIVLASIFTALLPKEIPTYYYYVLPILCFFIDAGASIAAQYESREFSAAIREIMALADKANQYIDEKKPWALAKVEGEEQQVHNVCSVGINLFRQLAVYLAPVLPTLAAQVQEFLKLDRFDFASAQTALVDHEIALFQPLMQRVDSKAVAAMVDASKDSLAAAAEPVKVEKKKEKKASTKPEPKVGEAVSENNVIGIEDFMKVDLRVAEVLEAATVEGSDKLLQLTLNVGEVEPRNVFSGIREFYQPEDLKGKLVVMVANLAPRKMRFGISNGMVLAAGNGEGVWVISPESGAKAGDKVS